MKLQTDYFSFEAYEKENNKVKRLLDDLHLKLITNNGNATCEDVMKVVRHLRYLADKLEERVNKTFDTIDDLGEL